MGPKKETETRTFLVQWLRLGTPTAGAAVLIPGHGTKTPHASRTEKLKLALCVNVYSSFIQNCSKPETQMPFNREDG